MAQIRYGVLLGDGDPATVGQVVHVVNTKPPFTPAELAHPCFPGWMSGAADRTEWLEKLKTLHHEMDERMIVLHDANLVWRKVSYHTGSDLRKIKKIGYYRSDDRHPIPELPAALAMLPFREVRSGSDIRFQNLRVHKI